jgi:hypothetical protein
MHMKLKFLHLALLAASLPFVAPSAHAQLGVYGTINAERLSGVACKDAPLACSYNDGVDRAIGGGGGIYYQWKQMGPALLGVDVRGDIYKSNKSASFGFSGNNAFRMDSALGGIRASFSAEKGFLTPYGEVLFGWNRRDRQDNFFAYRVVGGLDVNLTPIMAVRIPEVGVGQNIGMGGVKTNTVESVSVGVVFHTRRDR